MKNLMPISDDHFTSVPIVATIKKYNLDQNEDTWDDNDEDYTRKYPCLHLKNSYAFPEL